MSKNLVTDLIAEADKGIAAKWIVQTNNQTLNTPYQAGLTNSYTAGIAYINMLSTAYGTITYYAVGISKVFLAAKDNNNWSNWITLTTDSDLALQDEVEHFVGYRNGTKVFSMLKVANIPANSTNPQVGWQLIDRITNLIRIDISKAIILIEDEKNVQYPVESGAAGAFFRWNVSTGAIEIYFSIILNKAVTIGYYPVYTK